MDLKAASVEKQTSNAAMMTEQTPASNTASLQIPDTTVYDQNGRKLNFYTDLVKGKTVAINFIFTTCKTVCPPLTATFRQVQQSLGGRVGREIEMISISVDPTTDVPERLKEFSARFKAGPGWTFVTGEKPEIDKLLRALGAAVPDDKNNHTSTILIGNAATGHWTRTYGLAPAATILKVIDEAAETKNSEVAATTTASGAMVEVPPPGAPSSQSTTAGQNMKASSATPSSSMTSTAASAAQDETGVASRQKKLAASASRYFPNLVLVNQDNKPLHFYDDLLKGKTVMINFMLTHCTGACSPMTANLLKVQKYLGDVVGKKVLMISISVDPEHDTPAALKKYADDFKVQPGWLFLTGTKENIDGVLSKIGGYTDDPQKHSTALIIGDEATGQWMRVPALARPSEIADAVARMLAAKKDAESAPPTER
jgi:cytochrome oxidase Cu insertion factor (SCO1/SenC/PrrC family)